MPSKRSSAIIGIWVVIAVMVIADFAVFGMTLLDSFYHGLNNLMQVLILAFIPFIFASLLLDRRARQQEVPEPSRQRLPRGARSASGASVQSTRPQPRLKRDKRAAQLETIVVDPGAGGSTSTNRSPSTPTSTVSSQTSAPSSSKFLRARRSKTEPDLEVDQKVKEQLEALEDEMAKLEGELNQNGITISSPSNEAESQRNTNSSLETQEAQPQSSTDSAMTEEEASSELQAIDELLARLEQRNRAGGVDENTYQRLREKYLKRKAELARHH